VTLEVPLKYHQRLIGPGGARIREISARHGVQINVPRSEAATASINIVGYEASCNTCKEEIEQLIQDLESMVTQEISVDVRFHPRLIGSRGRNLRNIEAEFGVEIKMPGRQDPNPDMVMVSGKNEDAVYDCVDKIRREEEDFITDFADRGMYTKPREEPKQEKKVQQQVEFTGAPWQLDDHQQFPSMGQQQGDNSQPSATAQPSHHSGGGVWGNRRW